MDDLPSPVVDALVRLSRAGLMLAVIAATTGGLVAPVVTGQLSQDGDPVALGLVEWSNRAALDGSTGSLVWFAVVETLFWLSLVVAVVAVIRWLRLVPRVVSVGGKIITALYLTCVVLVYPLSGQVTDRADDDWQFQWGWWVIVLAGILSALAIWFEDQLRDAPWHR